MKKYLSFLVLGLIMAGCTTQKDFVLFNETNITKPQAQESVTTVRIPAYEYRIAPHDRVSVTMYNHPEFGTSSASSQKEDKKGILVNSRGYVSLPLIKKLYVVGLTQTAAKEKIEKAYKSFNIPDAEVYVEVLNKRAYIIGEVTRPGEIPLFNERLSLLQVLAKAGGLKDTANRRAIVLLQKRGSKVYTKTVDLTGVNSLKVANLMIHPNDTVYITPNNMKSYNVGVQELSPTLGLASSVISPIATVQAVSQ